MTTRYYLTIAKQGVFKLIRRIFCMYWWLFNQKSTC